MGGTIVSAHDLSKTYRVYARPIDRLIEGLIRRPRHAPFDALRGISFEVPKGEGLGIIGENGAGKSTLLKILAGITAPTSGDSRLEGSVASILELGSAFHGELTGRQNIVLNAAMFGLDREQVVERTPRIIEFSELGQFIDRPIKTYSTGMVMRLGFAIAIQVEPEVLLIDEALSVGDGYFQKKCMVHLTDYVDKGGTLLICSHAMYYISAFCKRALWLHEGRIEALGPTQEVVPRYEAHLDSKTDRFWTNLGGVRVASRAGSAADSNVAPTPSTIDFSNVNSETSNSRTLNTKYRSFIVCVTIPSNARANASPPTIPIAVPVNPIAAASDRTNPKMAPRVTPSVRRSPINPRRWTTENVMVL